MRATTITLLGVLAAAVGLWLWTRTQRGQAAAADAVGFAAMTAREIAGLPRGVRNNNPGNIEWLPPARAWRGQVGNDGRFGVYDSPANGVRAVGQELLKDWRAGADTIRELITAWAPPNENDTEAYVRAVARAVTGRAEGGSDSINVQERLPALVAAVIKHENGQQPYAAADLQRWVYA